MSHPRLYGTREIGDHRLRHVQKHGQSRETIAKSQTVKRIQNTND